MNLSTYLGNAFTRVWKDILGIPDYNATREVGFAKISAGVLPRSGGSRLSDKEGGCGLKWNFLRPFGPQFGLNIRGAPSLDPPLIRKENGFKEKDDRSSGYGFVVKKERECGLRTRTHLLADPELPSLFHFLNVWQTKAISHSPTSTTTKTTNFIEIQHISNYIIFPPSKRL